MVWEWASVMLCLVRGSQSCLFQLDQQRCSRNYIVVCGLGLVRVLSAVNSGSVLLISFRHIKNKSPYVFSLSAIQEKRRAARSFRQAGDCSFPCRQLSHNNTTTQNIVTSFFCSARHASKMSSIQTVSFRTTSHHPPTTYSKQP